MVSRKISRLLTVVLTASLAVSMVGCNKDPLAKLSKDELIARSNQQTADNQAKDVRIEELETLLKGVQEENGPTASISTMDDGTGRLTFNSIDGKIIFPTELAYPNSTQAANTSCINITDQLSVSPTNNWTAVLDGAAVDLNHTNGVTGKIRAGSMKEMVDADTLQNQILSGFFTNLPPGKIVYSKLFLEDKCWGVDAKAPTTIDSKPAFIRCGIFGFGEMCFTYMFLYNSEQDAAKDETILSLLKTIKVFQQPLRVG